MKKFILSDLHIGFENSLYPEMEKTIDYISQKAEAGDKILGLGDWFHIKEEGFDKCIKHEMTQKYRDLANKFPTKLVLGNHDKELKDYQLGRKSPNPISPIEIIDPFWENGFFYCHGHEFDYIGRFMSFPAFWDRFVRRKTPGQLMSEKLTWGFLAAVNNVHSNALLSLPNKAKTDGKDCKGIVLGHTHFPVIQESPELPCLINDGDMRHSATFVIQDSNSFQLMRWDNNSKNWQIIASLPYS
ncbi:MAG TPA: metallophosphoesterase [Dehalococcoidia bacterium]|nr:metallophosphoesterase [Dehalococcoidia bacterium]